VAWTTTTADLKAARDEGFYRMAGDHRGPAKAITMENNTCFPGTTGFFIS
jgi:hypothetical protein